MKVRKLLKNFSSVEIEEKNRCIPIIQLCILYETWVNEKNNEIVTLRDIQKRYGFTRQLISRNSMFLANGYNYKNSFGNGKGWVRRENHGKYKKIQLTERGHMIANRLFKKERNIHVSN